MSTLIFRKALFATSLLTVPGDGCTSANVVGTKPGPSLLLDEDDGRSLPWWLPLGSPITSLMKSSVLTCENILVADHGAAAEPRVASAAGPSRARGKLRDPGLRSEAIRGNGITNVMQMPQAYTTLLYLLVWAR